MNFKSELPNITNGTLDQNIAIANETKNELPRWPIKSELRDGHFELLFVVPRCKS